MLKKKKTSTISVYQVYSLNRIQEDITKFKINNSPNKIGIDLSFVNASNSWLLC